MRFTRLLFILTVSFFIKGLLWAGDDEVLNDILNLIDSRREEQFEKARIRGGTAVFRSREELEPLLRGAIAQARTDGVDPTSLKWISNVVSYAMYDIDRPLLKYKAPAPDAPRTIYTGNLSLEKNPYTQLFEFKREAEFIPSEHVQTAIQKFHENPLIQNAIGSRDDAEGRLESSFSRYIPNYQEVVRSWSTNNEVVSKEALKVTRLLVEDAVSRGYDPHEVVSELIGNKSTRPILTAEIVEGSTEYRSSWSLINELTAEVKASKQIGTKASENPELHASGNTCLSKLRS